MGGAGKATARRVASKEQTDFRIGCLGCGAGFASLHDAIRHAEDDHKAASWQITGWDIRPLDAKKDPATE